MDDVHTLSWRKLLCSSLCSTKRRFEGSISKLICLVSVQSGRFRRMPLMRKFSRGLEGALRLVGMSPELLRARKLKVGTIPDLANRHKSRTVAILTPRSWAYHANFESIVHNTLLSHGARVVHYTCGGDREYCDRVHIHDFGPPPCFTCKRLNTKTLNAHGVQPIELQDGMALGIDDFNTKTLEELLCYRWEGIPLGELVVTSVRWFLCSEDLSTDPLSLVFLRSALREGRRFIQQLAIRIEVDRPDVIFMLNGQFFFERLATHYAELQGIRVVTYERGYDKGSIFVSTDGPASRYETKETWPQVSERVLDPQQDAKLDSYLTDRTFGRRSIANFWPDPVFSRRDGNYSVLLTNVVWDTAAQNRGACYPDQRSWLQDVVSWYGSHPEHHLVVRIHPAEVRVPGAKSREGAADVVRQIAGMPFPNVEIVEPNDPQSTYPLIDGAQLVHVFASTVGLESAIKGKPCLVAGDAQFAFKGFTFEPSNPEEYRASCEKFLKFPPHVDVRRARNFAYFFFFEAQARLDEVISEPQAGLVRLGTSQEFRDSVLSGTLREIATKILS